MSKVASFGGIGVASGIAGLQQARSSIPNPPEEPTYLDLAIWIVSFGDPLALLAAVVAAIGTGLSLYQVLAQSPYTSDQGESDRAHQNASFGTLDQRNTERSAHIIEAIKRDKHEQVLADLIAGKADQKLLQRYERALNLERFDGHELSKRQAGEIALVADVAEESGDPVGRRIAELIDAGAIVEAAKLKAEQAAKSLGYERRRTAREFKDAGYLALPFNPSEAVKYFMKAADLDPEDVWSRIEQSRILSLHGELDRSENLLQQASKVALQEYDQMGLANERGQLAMLQGQHGQAKQLFAVGLRLAEKRLEDRPSNDACQQDLAISYSKIATACLGLGDLDNAELLFRSCVEIDRSLFEKHSRIGELARPLSVGLMMIGDVQLQRAILLYQSKDESAAKKRQGKRENR
ncbi:hypothetical protein C8024_00600 [Sphingopyxis sp. BSNA05]|nr:hypothetical protein [Sphingopyxis sp. BSNA05]